MSRLENREKESSVIDELSSIITVDDKLNKYKRVTFSMTIREEQQLDRFVEQLKKEVKTSEKITKSYIVRKALELLYSKKDKIFK